MKVDYSHNSALVGMMPTGTAGCAKQASRIVASYIPRLTSHECQKTLFCAIELIRDNSALIRSSDTDLILDTLENVQFFARVLFVLIRHAYRQRKSMKARLVS